jgi:hypothetical protein
MMTLVVFVVIALWSESGRFNVAIVELEHVMSRRPSESQMNAMLSVIIIIFFNIEIK